jgi:putative Holliday junction resolvase
VFVVGKPSRLDGSDTDATKHVEIFVNSLVKNFPQIPVERVDERFTSLIAKRSLVEIGMKKKDRQNKENLDQVSAALILQSYMEMKNR